MGSSLILAKCTCVISVAMEVLDVTYTQWKHGKQEMTLGPEWVPVEHQIIPGPLEKSFSDCARG